MSIMLVVVRTGLFAVLMVRNRRVGVLVGMAVLVGMFVGMSHTIVSVFVGVTMLVLMFVLMRMFVFAVHSSPHSADLHIATSEDSIGQCALAVRRT
jgi:hypothetical protein